MKHIGLMVAVSLASTLTCAGQHAFLVQNSGWMEPFYQDQNSQLKPLVNAVVQTVTQPNDTVAVSMFNQSNTTAQSPVLIYQGAGKQFIRPIPEALTAKGQEQAEPDVVEETC